MFRSRRGDRLEILAWGGDGFVLCYKRLESGVFKLPRVNSGCAPPKYAPVIADESMEIK